MQHRLGADDHAFAAVFVADGLGEDGLELLTHPTHADTEVAQLRRAARGAHDRPFGAAALAAQHVARRLHDRGIATLARRDLTADRARQEARAALAVEHAHDATRAHSPDCLQQSVRVQARRGDRHAGGRRRRGSANRALLVARRLDDTVRDRQRLERRARREQHARDPGTPSTLDRNVTRVPRRRALLLQALVVLVDDHDRLSRPARDAHTIDRRPSTTSAPSKVGRATPAAPGSPSPPVAAAPARRESILVRSKPCRAGAPAVRPIATTPTRRGRGAPTVVPPRDTCVIGFSVNAFERRHIDSRHPRAYPPAVQRRRARSPRRAPGPGVSSGTR